MNPTSVDPAVDAQGFTQATLQARHAGPGAHLNSALLAHAQRWQISLPSRDGVLAMLSGQPDAGLAALHGISNNAATPPQTLLPTPLLT